MSLKTALERFSEKFVLSDSGCFDWIASKNNRGYGTFWTGASVRAAHRWMWEELVGPVADGMELDHLCRNKGCVNPDHLEEVTAKENVQRSLPYHQKFTGSHNKSHCINGHLFAEINTYINPQGYKICKTCRRAADSRRPDRCP